MTDSVIITNTETTYVLENIGLVGATGPTGPTGPQGEQGPQGIQGIPGADAPTDTYLPLAGGTLTGNLTINKTTPSLSLTGSGVGSLRITSSDNNALLYLGAPAGLGYSGIQLLSGSNARWYLRKNFATESGSNAGSNLEFAAIADDGSTTISTPFSIARSTGLTTLTSLAVSGVSSFTGASSFTGQMSLVNGVPATVKFAKASQWGYSSGYRAIILGDTAGGPNNVTVAIGYDPVGNANGSFTGNGSEVLFRNAVQFVTPNAADNAWLKPLKFDSSGNTTLLGLTAGTTSLTGDLTISKASAVLYLTGSSPYSRINATSGHSYFYMDRIAGSSASIRMRTGSSMRWEFGVNAIAESGSNAGSDFGVYSYTDAGAYLATPLSITRSTGAVTLTGTLTVPAVTLGSIKVLTGTGSPEGVVTAPVSSTWHRTDGGAGTSFYVKESGTGNTGWVAK